MMSWDAVSLAVMGGRCIGRNQTVGGMMAQDYRELATTLRGRIDAGEFRQIGKLPTEDQLIEEYQTTRYRVRNAIALLAEAGDVFPVRGQRRARARGP